MSTIVLSGGGGYIGSSIAKSLHEKGYRVVILDLSIQTKDIMDYCSEYYCVDLRNEEQSIGVINDILNDCKGSPFKAFIHLAAWKNLTESYDNPFEYYRNNLEATINALRIANALGVITFLFSSSAAVYDDTLTGSVKETDKVTGDSPYGYSKLVCERIVQDVCLQYGMRGYCLRYCNPFGTDGLSLDRSDSMFGNIVNAIESKSVFKIFGDDYDTEDGTPIRDYIDLRDVVRAHVHFIEHSLDFDSEVDVINIGSGKGISCLEVCKIVKQLIPEFKYVVGKRREGDAAGSYADVELASKYGFTCKYPLKDSILNLLRNIKLPEGVYINLS